MSEKPAGTQLPPFLFVHAGEFPLPHCAPWAWSQVRLFNPSARIVCAAPRAALERQDVVSKLEAFKVEPFPLESLKLDAAGISAFDEFYRLACERFVILERLMEALDVQEAFHLENDVALYLDLSTKLAVMRELYAGRMALPFDSDSRGVPSFVYIGARSALTAFNRHMRSDPSCKMNDMARLAVFRKTPEGAGLLSCLPIVHGSYRKSFPLAPLRGAPPERPEDFSSGVERLGVIFDAAAIGQFLGGPDPRNTLLIVDRGFINETCVFDPSKLDISWRRDEAGRNVPFASVSGETLQVACLHVHSKAMEEFLSDEHVPLHEYIHGDVFKDLAGMQFLKPGRLIGRGSGSGSVPKCVYVDGDMMPLFLKSVLPQFPESARLVLISTNDDSGFVTEAAPLLDDPRIFRWFMVNMAFEHPKLRALPLGLARPFWPHGSQRAVDFVARREIPKRGLVYMNFTPGTNMAARMAALDALAKKPFVFNGGRKPFELYLAEQKAFHFSVCPHGNALDSHRVWECLYTGVIPIVPDCPLYRSFPSLPLCIVKSWDELTESFLQDFLKSLEGRPVDLSPLEFSYWRKLVREEIKAAGLASSSTPAAKSEEPSGQARLLVEGWRGISHSYAMVNQFQCLEFLKMKNLHLRYREAPFPPGAAWKRQPGIFGEAEEASLNSLTAPAAGERFDALLRIAFPYDLTPSKDAERTVVFSTCEFSSPNPNDYTVPLSSALKRGELEVLTPSNWSKAALVRGGAKPELVHVVPHGYDASVFRPAEADLRAAFRRALGWENRFVFLHIGAMTANKGVGLMLRAFAKISEKRPEAMLVLKGSDTLYQSMGNLARKLRSVLSEKDAERVGKRISYFGEAIRSVDIARLHQAADVYLAPYYAEGFNLPVMEAAACGLPVICTANGPTDDFTTPDFALRVASAIGVLPEDPSKICLAPFEESLLDCMERATSDSAWMAAARRKGPEWTSARYTMDKIARRILELLFPGRRF